MPRPDITPALSPGSAEIHLWVLQLTVLQTACESWLGEDEQRRLENFRTTEQSRRYLASRCAMRQILSRYAKTDPQNLIFSAEKGGKPYLAAPHCELQFNLSHTGDMGLLAVARQLPLGVDIEPLRPIRQKLAIARRLFSEQDITALLNTPIDQQDAFFLQLWTSLEARQKCRGNGIFGERTHSLSVGLYHFSPMPGYCASVAWDGPQVQPALKLFDLQDY